MCATCGCSGEAKPRITGLDGSAVAESAHADGHHAHAHDHDHVHDHEYEHAHAHEHGHSSPPHLHTSAPPHDAHRYLPTDLGLEQSGRTLRIEKDVLEKNDRQAAQNRGWFAGRGIVALNLMSSPGAGKTTLLERTIRDLQGAIPLSVIEGDQETARDAQRIRATGCRAVQINTGTGCHLDAEMVAGAVRQLDPPQRSLLLIENVGNLVCPALFDLGERAKVIVMSVTEGEDKPLKYPHMFRASRVMILNKTDLLPHLDFDVARCIEYARRVNPALDVFQLSATRSQGLDAWYAWLRGQHALAAER